MLQISARVDISRQQTIKEYFFCGTIAIDIVSLSIGNLVKSIVFMHSYSCPAFCDVLNDHNSIYCIFSYSNAVDQGLFINKPCSKLNIQ